jgi:hypothetical protein
MKYIRLFNTQAEKDATSLIPPYLVYTKETRELEMQDVTPINSADDPELMALMYSWGWAEHEHFMMFDECAAVTDAQFASKAGTSESDSLFVGIKDFSSLQYFTGLTTIPHYCFKAASSITRIIFPESVDTIGNYIFSKNACTGVADMSKTKITRCPLFWNGSNQCGNLKGLSLPATCYYIGNGSQGVWDGLASRTGNLLWFKIPSTQKVCCTRYSIGTSSISKLRLYVPDDMVETYKTDTETDGQAAGRSTAWSTYANNFYPMSQWQTDVNNGVIEG